MASGDRAAVAIVVGGDAPTRAMLRFLLEDRGCSVIDVAPGGPAARVLDADHPDALVLTATEEQDGSIHDLLWRYRARYRCPAVLLARRVSRELRARATTLGLRDVISLPCDAVELQRRLVAAFNLARLPAPAASAAAVRAGGLTLDAEARTLHDDRGWEAVLTRQETALLRGLMRAPGQVVPYQSLQADLWADTGSGTANSIAVYVRRLRAKLTRPSAPHGYIRTAHSRGYAFDARSVPRDEADDDDDGAGESPHVLVVDDDAAITAFVTEVLRRARYRVCSDDGAHAPAAVRRLRPALVLLDINMPGMDGVEVRRQLRGNPRTAAIPVIAMSAGGNLRQYASAMDADDYLPKPFAIEDLLLRVEKWVSPPAAASP